jgi:hypothetical protein
MDSEPVRNEREQYMLIHRHYEKIRSSAVYRQSKFIFIPENNLGMEHHHLDAMVRDIPDVTTFWETFNKPGITKTEKSTREYQFLLSNCLANNSLLFERTLFTCTREKTPEAMLDMLEDQMSRFHWAIKKANDEHGTDKAKLTGKVGNQQDDLLIAVAMVIYVGRMIIRDPRRLEIDHA